MSGQAALALAAALSLEPVSLPPSPLTPASAPAPVFRQGLVFPARSSGNAHGASLAELPDGRIAVSWFAGEREGARDSRVLLSLCGSGGCSEPRVAVAAGERAEDAFLPSKTVGNSALLLDSEGTLWLFYVSVWIGGWAGSVVDYKVSHDLGASWSRGRRLLGELGTLVRTPPLALAPGVILLPVYSELLEHRGYVCRVEHRGGRVLSTRCGARMLPDGAIQPAIARTKEGRLLALMRDKKGQEIRRAWSDDEGDTWSPVEGLGLPNPGSSVALAALDDGRLLLLYNPRGRHVLSLAVSDDSGRSFRHLKDLENATDASAEFSYPAAIQARDGLIHAVYTHQRKSIKHVAFDKAWLDAP